MSFRLLRRILGSPLWTGESVGSPVSAGRRAFHPARAEWLPGVLTIAAIVLCGLISRRAGLHRRGARRGICWVCFESRQSSRLDPSAAAPANEERSHRQMCRRPVRRIFGAVARFFFGFQCLRRRQPLRACPVKHLRLPFCSWPSGCAMVHPFPLARTVQAASLIVKEFVLAWRVAQLNWSARTSRAPGGPAGLAALLIVQ
jgi:hypothetical protein